MPLFWRESLMTEHPYTSNSPEQRAQLIAHSNRAQTAYNGEDVNFNGILDDGEDKDNNGEITRCILPAPPDIPKTRVESKDGKIEVYWTDNAESTIDPITQEEDFEGYRVYLSKLGFDVVGVPDLQKDWCRLLSLTLLPMDLPMKLDWTPSY